MSIQARSTRLIAGGAVAIGLTLGVAALAGAASSPGQTASASSAEQDQRQDPSLNGSIQAPENESIADADEAKVLQGLATVSPADAEAAALAAVPGGSLNKPAALENENGSVVYQVVVTDAKGQSIEVKVDAGNGEVLAQEASDGGDGDAGSESGEGAEAAEGPDAPEVAPVR